MREELEKSDKEVYDFSKIKKFVDKIAQTNATILLTGNSGSGKSRLAKIIHENSHRNTGPLVEIHCTTIPAHLIESELFGHVKGAFTGAFENKMGKVQVSDKGTLFLDEIGELSLEGQAKLLRLIQDKVICRVGSNNDIHVDTRIILATNKNLKKMVERNEFREDLYYRINMFECFLPDLKDNKKEIERLIYYFLTENGRGMSYNMPRPLLEKLINYHWPGNIRELKNVIERLCFLADGTNLNLNDLPEAILNSTEKKPILTVSHIENDLLRGPFITLKELEKKYILSVIQKEPNFDKAAQILGITKVTLWRKRKEYSHLLH